MLNDVFNLYYIIVGTYSDNIYIYKFNEVNVLDNI